MDADELASVFRPAAVARLRAEYLAGRVHWSRVWAVAILELWLREERARSAAPIAAHAGGVA
jgi:hypothetical protein